MIERHSPLAVPPDVPTDRPPTSGDDPEPSSGKPFPWLLFAMLLIIAFMSVGTVFTDHAMVTYKKGFEELRKICSDQSQLIDQQATTIRKQTEAMKAHDVDSEKFKADTAVMAISAYNLGYAHYPPEQFLGVLTNQLGITNAVVDYFTNDIFEAPGTVTNQISGWNRREL